jgi:TatD DNase family protein
MNSKKETFFDSHLHLDHPKFKGDTDKVILRARNAGVAQMTTVGVNNESSADAIKISEKHDGVYASVGISPHDAGKASDLSVISNLVHHDRVVAVGETGLDYHYDFTDRETQKSFFEKHIHLAHDVDLPIIIHMRNSSEDIFGILEKSGVLPRGGVFHCFTGTFDEAAKAIEMGFYISFSGIITFDKSMILKSIIPEIPGNRLLIETDAPYLAPAPHRGKRAEPSMIVDTAKAISEFTKLSLSDIARLTRKNACRLFNIPIDDTPAVAYPIRNSLYLNITNRCSNDCIFCIRNEKKHIVGHNLMLDHEPDVEEIWRAIREADVTQYKEVVFCGYGEPTLRLDVLREIARRLKMENSSLKIRLNTNGQGSLIYGDDIVPMLIDCIDMVSISLNTADPQQYIELCKPIYGDAAFPAIIEFSKRCIEAGIGLQFSAINLSEVNLGKAKNIADRLGAQFLIRKKVQI